MKPNASSKAEKDMDAAKVEAEVGKLITEAAKLNAETAKLHAESRKLAREAQFYPFIAGAALVAAITGAARLFH